MLSPSFLNTTTMGLNTMGYETKYNELNTLNKVLRTKYKVLRAEYYDLKIKYNALSIKHKEFKHDKYD